MNKEASIAVQHNNCLNTYLNDWRTIPSHVLTNIKPKLAQRYNLIKIPTTFESLQNNTYDLSVVLAHLASWVRVFEGKSIPQLDIQAYTEARVLLKAFYVFFRILLDDISGVIKSLYKNNRPEAKGITNGFHALLEHAKKRNLLENLPAC